MKNEMNTIISDLFKEDNRIKALIYKSDVDALIKCDKLDEHEKKTFKNIQIFYSNGYFKDLIYLIRLTDTKKYYVFTTDFKSKVKNMMLITDNYNEAKDFFMVEDNKKSVA